MSGQINPLLIRPKGAELYNKTKATWLQRGTEPIQVSIDGSDMVPVWIPMEFLRTSGDFSWAYVMLVYRIIVCGHGMLCHGASREQVCTQTIPEAGEYVYMPLGTPAFYRLVRQAAMTHSYDNILEISGFTGWTLGPDGSSRKSAPQENEGWHDSSSVTTHTHV